MFTTLSTITSDGTIGCLHFKLRIKILCYYPLLIPNFIDSDSCKINQFLTLIPNFPKADGKALIVYQERANMQFETNFLIRFTFQIEY